MTGTRAALVACLLLAVPSVRGQETCGPAVEPLRAAIVLDFDAPQGVAVDADGHFWISSALSHDILHLDAGLEPVEIVTGQVPRVDNPFGNHFTGIAYNPDADTLFVCRAFTKEIWEIEKDGSLTGFVLTLNLPPPPNLVPEPFPKGIAFDVEGDGGNGSIWVVESVMSAVYEVSLAGDVLRSLCHPDDPDGCPGGGSAATGNDVGLFLDGEEPVLELTGGAGGVRDSIVRVDLDGVPSGVRYEIGIVGGNPGGFLRHRFRPAGAAEPVEAFFVTVESSSEFHVLGIADPDLRPPLDLVCSGSAEKVALEWRNTDAYDDIEIHREGRRIATLASAATSFDDTAPPHGTLEYELVARRGDCRATVSCSVVFGPGRVIASLFVDGLQLVDLAEDSEGFLWVTHATNEIGVYTKDLELLFFFPGPFLDEGDVTSGIAFNPRSSPDNPTFFVYNAARDVVVEMDGGGQQVGVPFPSGVPGDAVDSALVPTMLHDPAGDRGAGSFWYVDYTSGTLQERARDGGLLHSCVHPDHAAEPPPAGSRLKALVWGVSAFPGAGFDRLELTGGRVRDGVTRRFLEVDVASCAPTGREISTDGVAEISFPAVLSFLRTRHRNRDVYFVINSNSRRSWFLEVDATPPDPPVVSDLRCSQPGPPRDVEIRFRLADPADGVQITRDGEIIADVTGAALAADPVVHVDRDAPSGRRTYSVRATRGGVTGDDRVCSLVVGPGAIVRRGFSHPVNLISQLIHDPVEGVLIAATTSNRLSDSLHRFGEDLEYRDSIDSPFSLPWQVAALAVRVEDGASEYHCLGWTPGSPPRPDDVDVKLPVRVIASSGEFRRQFEVPLPRPRRSLVVFPSGMAWDEGTDTLWILERNSRTVINVDLDGAVLSGFPHPAPIHQDGVANYGMVIDGARNAMYLSSAGTFDRSITRIVELTRSGLLTGYEMPLGGGGADRVRGFTLDATGGSFVISESSTRTAVSDLVMRRAFGDVRPVRFLECRATAGGHELEWTNDGDYQRITIERSGEMVADLRGGVRSWTDPAPPDACGVFYRVVAHSGEQSSAGVICEPSPSTFVRGDVEENGKVNISDAVAILEFLFLGGRQPACLDAADTDDSGTVTITDAVRLLGFLFLAGPPPKPPYPERGCDPTADGLGCSR